MKGKSDSEHQQPDERSMRCRLLPLFAINVPQHPCPLSLLQIGLTVFTYIQLLKFPIDYNSRVWLGSTTPFFLYLDPTYYSRFLNAQQVQMLLITFIIIMNLYYLIISLIFVLEIKYSEWMVMVRKLFYLLMIRVFFAPSFRLMLAMFSNSHDLHASFSSVPVYLIVIYIFSFMSYSCFLAVQIQINFQFLSREKNYTLIRKSCQIPLFMYRYYMTCELVVTLTSGTLMMVVLAGMTFAYFGFVLWMDQIKDQNAKLVEFTCSFILVFTFFIGFIIELTGLSITLYMYSVLIVLIVAGILQLKPYSLRFELDNINKWPTAAIMLRYAGTISYYMSRQSQYLFRVWIHGYMQIHRQKCDNITCPSRCALSQYQNNILKSYQDPQLHQQILRIKNIIKVIFTAGYKLSPVPPEIQLENSLFLYHSKQYELALRKLLMIKEEDLTLSQYYMHQYLKQVIKGEIRDQGKQEFLDLVTEIRLQYEEEELRRMFEKAALLNLQFWSILNDDHPDFQKLNEVASERVKISEEVTEQFKNICSYAHSQKITIMYASYLENLQNDEQLLMDINSQLEQQYKLNNQVLVRDWSNSSTAVFLVSLEADSQGKIIEINAPCATLLGYQKHSIINQSIKNLYPENFYTHERCTQLTSPQTNGQRFLLGHKNGHIVPLKKRARTYNSMAYGLCSLIEVEYELPPFSSLLLVDKNKKIISSSSSLISIMDLDLKVFQGEAYTYHFFLVDLITKEEETSYPIGQLLKADFITPSVSSFSYSVQSFPYQGAYLVEVRRQIKKNREARTCKEEMVCTMFQFRVQSSRKKCIFVGGSYFMIRNLKFKPFELGKQQKNMVKAINYGQNISTLRLQNNVIQYIEDQEQEENQFKRGEQRDMGAMENIPRKSEEQIFASKKAYQQFLQQHKLGKKVNFFLAVLVVLVFIFYLVNYLIFRQQLKTVDAYSSQIVYQNLIIGSMYQQARYLHEFQLQINNLTNNNPQTLIQEFNNNLAFLQEVSLKGSQPFNIQVMVLNTSVSQLTSQYISTLINYGTQLSSALGNSSTPQELHAAISSLPLYNLQFIHSTDQAQVLMNSQLLIRQAQMVAQIDANIKIQVMFLALGLILLTLAGIIIYFYFYKLNEERQKVFQVFLEISEALIQSFSSKTERFLISLHSQDSSEMVEQEHEVKKSSSSFAKKKSFKLISFNKVFYVKVSVVLIVMCAFFIHSYMISHKNTAFQSSSAEYFRLTSMGDTILAKTANHLSEAFLVNSTTIDLAIQAERIRYYYRDYQLKHEQSFGIVLNYEQVFDLIFNQDICLGNNTHYGWVSIPQSCQLPLLSPNGSYLILTNLYRNIHMESHGYVPVDLTFYGLKQTHIQFAILSKAQRLLSAFLLQAQTQWLQNTADQLLVCLLLWVGISLAIAILIWGIQVRAFLIEINQIKNTLGILPINLVRKIPRALNYIKNIIEEDKNLW